MVRGSWIKQALISGTTLAWAVLVWTLEVSPEAFWIEGKPGQRVSKYFVVTNNSSRTVRVGADVMGGGEKGPEKAGLNADRGGEGQDGERNFWDRPVEKWMRLSPSVLVLGPGSSKQGRLTVRVPRTDRGEVQTRVVFRVADESLGGEMRLVRKVTVRVTGNEQAEVVIGDVGVGDKGKERVVVWAAARNVGNVSVFVNISAELDGPQGARWSGEGVSSVSIAPGAEKVMSVGVPLGQGDEGWAGAGRVVLFFRDSAGVTRRITKEVGEKNGQNQSR